MRHPFQVSIVGFSDSVGNPEHELVIAKRSTLDKANAQAAALRNAIGSFARSGVPRVIVADLRQSEGGVADTD